MFCNIVLILRFSGRAGASCNSPMGISGAGTGWMSSTDGATALSLGRTGLSWAFIIKTKKHNEARVAKEKRKCDITAE